MFVLRDNADYGPNTYGRDNKTRHSGDSEPRAPLSAVMRDRELHTLRQTATTVDTYQTIDGGVQYGLPRTSYQPYRFQRYSIPMPNHTEIGASEREQQQRSVTPNYVASVGAQPRPYYGGVLNPYVRLDMRNGDFRAAPTDVRYGMNEQSVSIPYGVRRE